MGRIVLSDFSGGLNIRDSVNALALNETPYAVNWSLDERGSLTRRRGCANETALPGTTGAQAYIFYSAALDKWFCQRQSGTLYVRPGDLTGSWTDLAPTSLGAGPCAFIDFPGNPPKLVFCNTTGGVYTYDGTTVTRVSTTVKGSAIALWQNKAWVAGYPTSDANGNPTRLQYCKAGDLATWGDWIDLREKDAEALTALGVAGGALLVFKQRSAYRVNNAETGAYSMVDAARGCYAARTLTTLDGRLLTFGADRLPYAFDGIGAAIPIGDKLYPFSTVWASDPPPVAAGTIRDTAIFAAYMRVGTDSVVSSVAGTLWEYDPRGAWAQHTLANAAQDNIGSFAVKGRKLYAAIEEGDALFSIFDLPTTPGADGGTVYTATYRTPWIQPENGKLCRIERADVQGLVKTGSSTTLKLRIYTDWDTTTYVAEFDLSSDLRGGDAGDQQEIATIRSVTPSPSRAFAFEFVAGTAAGEVTVRSLTLESVALER